MTKCAHVRFFGDLDSLREASEDAVRFAGVSSRSMTWTPCYDSVAWTRAKAGPPVKFLPVLEHRAGVL